MPAQPRTIAEFARALRAGDVTAERTTEHCLQQIAEKDPSINAFITVLADPALAQARQADRELAGGLDRGPLHGLPVSLKDIIDVQGVPTTAASRVRARHVAAADAAVVSRLRAGGAVFLGKTNLHEFALGTTNEDSAYGPVRHPLNLEHSPGGSSGGSAASVLAGMAFASIGTDTGGSIRIPSAACGLVGLKPALGEISMDGIVPLSSTMDHVGPICRSVEDAATVFHVLRAGGPAVGGGPARGPIGGLARLRIGVLRGYFTACLDAQVAAAFDALCQRLAEAGATVGEATIPHAGDIAAVYLHIVMAEAATYHAPTLERRAEDYTANVRLRLEMGRYILAEDYLRALRGREQIRLEVDAALGPWDALLLPALAVPATRLGAETVRIDGADEPVRSIMLRLTQLFNLTGHPAISVPCGTTDGGLLIGAQLAAADTDTLLGIARALEPCLA